PEALLEPTAVAYWLTLVSAVVPPLVLMLVLPRRTRAWILLAFGALGTAVIFADAIYYRFFGDVVSVPALLAAQQTGHVVGSIRTLLTPGLLWLVVDLPFAVWLRIELQRLSPEEWLPRRGAPAAAIAVGVVLAAAGLVL